jgi:hypothetical protein
MCPSSLEGAVRIKLLTEGFVVTGAPAFLKHVPLLGGALRGICVRAVKRLVEVIPLFLGMLLCCAALSQGLVMSSLVLAAMAVIGRASSVLLSLL